MKYCYRLSSGSVARPFLSIGRTRVQSLENAVAQLILMEIPRLSVYGLSPSLRTVL